MDNTSKKELRSQYKEREIIGGIYIIKNKINNKLLLLSAVDLNGSKNRFQFAQNTDSCIHPKLQNDWLKYGHKAFELIILEELKKSSAQTDAEFRADIDLLTEIWLEKLSDESFY
ncbi:MAG: GIY-YIG nuclease family protein [Clostridiales bacterium]|jgi:hypothetical protein|nr:GIY-YIG nuclease family protein [Clostridiales bacterium]